MLIPVLKVANVISFNLGRISMKIFYISIFNANIEKSRQCEVLFVIKN